MLGLKPVLTIVASIEFVTMVLVEVVCENGKNRVFMNVHEF